MIKHDAPQPICASGDVPELGKYSFNVDYRGENQGAILIRFKGAVYGFLNRCVHMPRALDCEHCYIFDESGRFLQCSMHMICYEPTTGECLSEICAGKKLTALRVEERDGAVYLTDKRAAVG